MLAVNFAKYLKFRLGGHKIHVCFEQWDLINGLECLTIGRVTSTLAATDIREIRSRIHSSVLGLRVHLY